MALLLNVEGRERIFSLIESRFPEEDPADKVLDWVFALAQTRILGLNVPNALGIENFSDYDLIVFEDLMKGLSAEEIQRNLQTEIKDEDVLKNMTGRFEKIQQSVILKPLLEN